MRIVGDDLPMRKAEKAVGKGVRPLGRDVNAVLGDGLERRIGRLRRLPVELHVDAARPLDHGVASNGIGKGVHQDVGAGILGELDGFVDIGDEVARPLRTKGIRNWRLESEQ
jgi:hypothetical protein